MNSGIPACPRLWPRSSPPADGSKLIIRAGPVPDAMKPDFEYVLTHWNQGFMAWG